MLEDYGVAYEIRVLSAHRSPEEATRYAREAEGRGIKVLIAGAGGAAHLAGALAAHSTLPVIGVPLEPARRSAGFDALLSTVQMPPGHPGGHGGRGRDGRRNAGHLAVAILALRTTALRARAEGAAAEDDGGRPGQGDATCPTRCASSSRSK